MLNPHHCIQVEWTVHVGERFWGSVQLFDDQRYVEQRLVDVQQQEGVDIGVEPLDGGGPLCSGAAVNEPFVCQLDTPARPGVLAGRE